MSDEALKISCMTHFLSNLFLSHSAFFNYSWLPSFLWRQEHVYNFRAFLQFFYLNVWISHSSLSHLYHSSLIILYGRLLSLPPNVKYSLTLTINQIKTILFLEIFTMQYYNTLILFACLFLRSCSPPSYSHKYALEHKLHRESKLCIFQSPSIWKRQIPEQMALSHNHLLSINARK